MMDNCPHRYFDEELRDCTPRSTKGKRDQGTGERNLRL